MTEGPRPAVPAVASAPPTPTLPAAPIAIIVGLFLATLAMRPQLLAIGPLLPLIRDDLGLSAAVAGLLTTIPVLCMGLFAPIGPRLAAAIGPRSTFALCLLAVIAFGLVRALAPEPLTVLGATLLIGVGIGIAGAVPSMIVSVRLPTRPALGTGAYAAGIVAGSTLGAAFAVPLAMDGDWRRSLAIISIVSLAALAAWLVLIPRDATGRLARPAALRLPWRSTTGWLLVLVFGLQSVVFYGVVAWLPNAFVERGWSAADAGALVAVFNGVGLVTTIGIPLVADRLGRRRPQLVASSLAALVALIAVIVAPDLALVWVAVMGLALGIVFPLVLTLPLDVADEPQRVGSVAALMLLGGYLLSALGPFALGVARDVTGDFETSLWLLVGVTAALVACTTLLSPERLRRGIGR
jgi:CP family cyanate transporter-like MFS transporter